MGATEEERQQNLVELNRILHIYDINTPERIKHFFAQLMIETNNGQWLTEGYFWGATEETWDMWYPFRYRGAGYIQLTHEFHYQAFATYQLRLMFPELDIRWENPENTDAHRIAELYTEAVSQISAAGHDIDNDEDIVRITNVVNLGADFVATEFPWDTAGYFWDAGNVNTVIDGLTPGDKQGVERVTDVVNFHTPSRSERVDNYESLSNLKNVEW